MSKVNTSQLASHVLLSAHLSTDSNATDPQVIPVTSDGSVQYLNLPQDRTF